MRTGEVFRIREPTHEVAATAGIDGIFLNWRFCMAIARSLAGAGLALAVALAVVAFPAPPIAEAQSGPAMKLAPHRAVYEIKLDRAKGGSGVSDLAGRMVYELTGSACVGYTQTMRFVTRMTNQEGQLTISDLRSSSWEDAVDGHFRFNSTQYRNEKMTDATDGDARRKAPSAEVRVELTKPDKKEVTLKGGLMFPMQHSIAVIEAARAGRTSLTTDLYDGSDKGEKVYSTTAQIGKLRPPGSNAKLPVVKGAERLDQIPAWPVAISYFEPNSEARDAVPAYEISFIYFENGVSRQLLIDYGEFSIRGTLRSIEFLAADSCDR